MSDFILNTTRYKNVLKKGPTEASSSQSGFKKRRSAPNVQKIGMCGDPAPDIELTFFGSTEIPCPFLPGSSKPINHSRQSLFRPRRGRYKREARKTSAGILPFRHLLYSHRDAARQFFERRDLPRRAPNSTRRCPIAVRKGSVRDARLRGRNKAVRRR